MNIHAIEKYRTKNSSAIKKSLNYNNFTLRKMYGCMMTTLRTHDYILAMSLFH